MTFSEYINSLRNERTELIDEIAKQTMSSKNIVYRWIMGIVTPPPIKQRVISEITGIPVEDLFPTKK